MMMIQLIIRIQLGQNQYQNQYQYLRIIIQITLATTMQIYQDIQTNIANSEALLPNISHIYRSLLPKRKFISNGLTDQQSLALLYDHIRAPLKNLKAQLQQEMKQLSSQSEEFQEDQGEGVEQNEKSGSIPNQNSQNPENNQLGQENEMVDEDVDEDIEREQIDEELADEQDISDEDIGLYGEELDEQDMQSYQNEEMGDDPEFGNFNLAKAQKNNQQEGKEDQYIEQNFDQFRQIQMENQEKQKQVHTQLQQQIEALEEKALTKKNWVLTGQIKARERPVNSLLETELDYKSGIKHSHEINEAYNSSLQDIIKQRILDQIFDDRVRIIPNIGILNKKKLDDISTEKSNKGLAELYEIQFKNSLGIGDGKNEKLKKEIMDSLKQVSYYLDSLSNTGFSIKPKSIIQKNGGEAIVVEDKVPITSWTGTTNEVKKPQQFQSQKQENKKTKRLRNKRVARQRRKQAYQKKMNKSIEYSGMTKIQLEARKKIIKTKQSKHIKYNKSSSFFSNISKNNAKPGKPNANLGKIKI